MEGVNESSELEYQDRDLNDTYFSEHKEGDE